MKKSSWWYMSNRHWVLSAIGFGCVVLLVRSVIAIWPADNPMTLVWRDFLASNVGYLGLPFVATGLVAYARQCYQKRLHDKLGVLEDLWGMSWRDLEHITAEMFRRDGYIVELVGGKGPDGGIDLILHRSGALVLVQCKHWRRRKVGVSIVRELRGVMAERKASAGIIVTCGAFTREAEAFAGDNSIELVTGRDILERARGSVSRELQSAGLRYNGTMSNG